VNTPNTDDFRLERTENGLAVIFSPMGQSYAFVLPENGELSKPTLSLPQTIAADYADYDIRKTVTELARRTVSGSSQT
jgi:hypothetical protein